MRWAYVGGSRAPLRRAELRPVEQHQEPDVADQATQVGDDEVAAGTKHARELAERRPRMSEGSGAMAQTTTSANSSRGQRVQVRLVNSPAGTARARDEHPRRRVDADDGEAEQREVLGVAAQTTRRRERRRRAGRRGSPARSAARSRAAGWTGGRTPAPSCRSPPRRDRDGLGPGAERVRCVEQRSDLAEPHA